MEIILKVHSFYMEILNEKITMKLQFLDGILCEIFHFL